MCLTNNPMYVQDLLKRKSKILVGYKIVTQGREKVCNYSNDIFCTVWWITNKIIRLEAPYFDHIYKPGINKSNTERKKISLKQEEIRRGIYVYKSKKRAEEKCRNGQIVIRLTANKKDLLGADYHVMVFKKVHLSQQQYDKAIKEY